MFLAIIGLFSAVTLHSITAYDADCRPWQSGPLFVTHGKVGQSCAPGGPCGRSPLGDLPVEAVRFQLKGCAAPQPDAFVPTSKTCDGLTLLRYTGITPQAGHFSVIGQRTQIGYLGRPGLPAGIECAGVEGPVVHRRIEHPDRSLWGSKSFEAFRAPTEFTVTKLIEGRYRLTWRQRNTTGGETPTGIVLSNSEDVLRGAERNEAGHIKVTGRVRMTELQSARKNGLCTSRSTLTSELRVHGTALVLTAERTVAHVLEPRFCRVFETATPGEGE